MTVAAEGISVWVPIIVGVTGVSGALGSQWLSHHLTTKREKRASEDRLSRERHFITTELIILLERYAEGCARVVTDNGKDNDARQTEREPETDYPELNLKDVSGDWRVLEARLMYRIRELPVLQYEASRAIAFSGEMPFPPLHEPYFQERQYQYARLGLKAVILAVRLRRAIALPDTRLTGNEWSVVSRLRTAWQRERHRRAAEAISNRQWHEPVQPLQNNEENTAL